MLEVGPTVIAVQQQPAGLLQQQLHFLLLWADKHQMVSATLFHCKPIHSSQ
jgi:hypothetical protein